MGKIKLFSLLFLLIFCMCVFAKEKIKTFDENYICSEDDIEYSDYMEYENKGKPYRIRIHDENSISYEYHNCNREDYEQDDDSDSSNEKNKSRNKNNTIDNLSSNKVKYNSKFLIDPNIFYGKRKEECQFEDALLRQEYFLKPFSIDTTLLNDINSGSQYYYDDTKTAYFYPVFENDQSYSFVVMMQDGFSEYNQTIFVIDFCKYIKDDLGNWKISYIYDDNINAEEKELLSNSIEMAKSDVDMLIKKLDCKSKSSEFERIETYKLYRYASLEITNILCLRKSEYQEKVNEKIELKKIEDSIKLQYHTNRVNGSHYAQWHYQLAELANMIEKYVKKNDLTSIYYLAKNLENMCEIHYESVNSMFISDNIDYADTVTFINAIKNYYNSAREYILNYQ